MWAAHMMNMNRYALLRIAPSPTSVVEMNVCQQHARQRVRRHAQSCQTLIQRITGTRWP